MNQIEAQIAERMPVWMALSELFLDTEIQDSDIERIASVLAASKYTDKQIEDILRFEVTPPLKWNMMVVAGEWAGFDEDWIREKLTPRLGKRPFIRFPIFGMIQADWFKVRDQISLKRHKN